MLTWTKATGVPAAVYRTSSLFEDRLHRHILQFLRTLVHFFVLLVGCEEWFYLPVGSLPKIRRVISCILFLLEQSRVVNLTVAEHHPDVILESNVLNFEFSQLLLRRMNDSPKRFCRITLCAPLSIQFLTKTFCIRSRYAISQEWMSVSMLFLTNFMQQFFSLVLHSLSFRRSMSGAALLILLDNIARYWQDIVVALVDLLNTLRHSWASSTNTIDNACFPL